MHASRFVKHSTASQGGKSVVWLDRFTLSSVIVGYLEVNLAFSEVSVLVLQFISSCVQGSLPPSFGVDREEEDANM
jgi:hypothetical protein